MTDDALFLDFDGTLVEIVERPDAVVVDPALPGILARLRERLGGALALVSGRSVATLDGFLAPFACDAAGLHGVEYRVGGGDTIAAARLPDPVALRAQLPRWAELGRVELG
jgi:trehalose 6-phosphate phosphatase